MEALVLDFALDPESAAEIDIENRIHHLGNDNFTPSGVNGQFQIAAEPDLIFATSFEVSAEQLALLATNRATLRYLVRGVDEADVDEIRLDGMLLVYVPPSSSSGAVDAVSVDVTDLLLSLGAGPHTLEIESRAIPSSDLDDFEFAAVKIVIAP
jgi:hypothetical protein